MTSSRKTLLAIILQSATIANNADKPSCRRRKTWRSTYQGPDIWFSPTRSPLTLTARQQCIVASEPTSFPQLRAAALLQGTQHTSGQEPSHESTSASNSISANWQIHEALVACTLTFVCKGVDIHLTMRDVSDDALFARIKRSLPKSKNDADTRTSS